MSLVNRVLNKAKRVWNDTVFETALGGVTMQHKGQNKLVMYHGIDTRGGNPFNGRHTPVAYFEKHIQFLTRHYRVVPLTTYFNECASATNLCAITFDDGYVNNLTNALPVLEKYKCPATFYITGMNEIGCNILWADYVNIANKLCNKPVTLDGEQFVNKGSGYVSAERGTTLMDVVKNEKPQYAFKEKIYAAFDSLLNFKNEEKYFEYWKLMTDEQIRQMAKSNYAVIGSHGYYHNNLGNVATADACAELAASKKYLENLIQKQVTSIGYPDGSYSDEVSRYASEIGIVHQTCSEHYNKPADRQNPHLKNRAGIYNFDSAANQLLSAINYQL